MHTSTANRATGHQRRDGIGRRIRNLLLRKLWLPRIVYELLPYLYFVLGLAALVSAVYLPSWAWIFPFVILLGLLSLHGGLAIIALRYKYRRDNEARRRVRMDSNK